MMTDSISDNSFSSPTPSADSRQRRLLSSNRGSRNIRNSPAAGKSIMKKQQSISVKNLMGEEKNATEVNRDNSFNDSNSNSSRSARSCNSNIRRQHRRSAETPPTTPRTPTTTKANVILDGAATKIQNIMNAKKVKQGRRSDIKKSLNSAIVLDNDSDDDSNSSKDEGGASSENKTKEDAVVVKEEEEEGVAVAVEANSLILGEVDEDTPKRGLRKAHSSSQQLRRRPSSGPQSPNAKQRRENQDNKVKSPRSRMVRSRSERQQTSSNKDDAVVVDDDDSQLDNSIEGGSYELKPESPRKILVTSKSRRGSLKNGRERQQTPSSKDVAVVVDDDDSQLINSTEGSYALEPESTKKLVRRESTKILVRSKSMATDNDNENKNETAAKKSGAERRLSHRSKSRTRDGTRDRSKSRPRDTRDRSKSRLRDGTQSRSIDPNSSTSARRLRRHRSRSSSKGADTVRDSDRRRNRSSSRGADKVRDSDRLRARSSSRGADKVRDSDRRSRKSKSGDGDGNDSDNGDDDKDDDKSVATSATNTTAASRRGRRPPRQKTQRESDTDDTDDNDDDDDDEDTKSVGSIRSVASRASATSGITSKRGRRPKGVLNTPSTQKIPSGHSDQKLSLDDTSNNRNSQNANNLFSSPGTDTRKHMDRNKMAQSMSSLDYHFESHPPLSSHLESDNNIQGVKPLSIVDEERSIDTSRTGSKSQSILLQFDPTNENGIQTVNQTKAKKTSETIRQSDGTKSKFQISELAGLPTFERTKQQQQSQHGASFSDFSGSTEIKASESNRTVLSSTSSDGSTSVEGQHGNKSLSFLSLGKPRLSITKSSSDSHQNPGEAPEEEKKTGSNNKNKWNNLQATKSAFIQRVQKSKLQVTDSFMTKNRPSMDRTSLLGSSHQLLDDDDDSVGY
jgi:hypothetical protein